MDFFYYGFRSAKVHICVYANVIDKNLSIMEMTNVFVNLAKRPAYFVLTSVPYKYAHKCKWWSKDKNEIAYPYYAKQSKFGSFEMLTVRNGHWDICFFWFLLLNIS